MRNHSRRMARMVPNGTAPDELAEMRKRFNRKMTAKMTLCSVKRALDQEGTHVGNRVAVMTKLGFHWSPPNEMYVRLEA